MRTSRRQRSRPVDAARRMLPLTAVLLVVGCSEADTALRLRLVPDALLNSEQQIAALLDEIEIVLDAPTGFAGIDPGATDGALVPQDVDGDGTLELVLRRSVRGRSSLPLYRLLPGHNVDQSFRLTVRGLVAEQVAAVGGVSAARFTPGQTLDLLIPFNLRAAYLPPRVLITLPHDDQSGVPRALDRVYLEFSKMIAAPSTAGQLMVQYQGANGGVAVPGKWQLGTAGVVDLGLQESRSTATLRLGCLLNPGTYRVEARPGVRDAEGRALDQDAVHPGDDGYVGRFIIGSPAGAAATPCATNVLGCKDSTECNQPTSTADGSQTQPYVCVIDGEVGRCVPAKPTCSTLSCPRGLVCDPALTSSGADYPCVADCRMAGSICGAEKMYCDQQSGLCRPCEPGNSTDCAPSPPPPPPPPLSECEEKCADACRNRQDLEACKQCLIAAGCG